MPSDAELSDFRILRALGFGREGTVYQACRDGARVVLKVFSAEPSGWQSDLRAYCERVRSPAAGLFPVTQVVDHGRLTGVCYEYRRLVDIPSSFFQYSSGLREALLSQYCFTQAYLMSKHHMMMVDGPQFMLSLDGCFYYVDYGSTIVTTDNEWCRSRGYAVFSLMRAIFEPHGICLEPNARRPGFEYGRPCQFIKPSDCDAVVDRSPWAEPVIATVRRSNAAVFLEPHFYTWVAGQLERSVRNGPAITAAVRGYRLFVLAYARARSAAAARRSASPPL